MLSSIIPRNVGSAERTNQDNMKSSFQDPLIKLSETCSFSQDLGGT